MLEISTLNDIAALRENIELECKLAAGKDGNGELPKDFWETYSAFANSDGGDILLGVEEKKLRMLDLLPEGAIERLQAVFGDAFEVLNKLERLILATAVTEQVVTHRRMIEITTEHAHDLTLAFQSLTKNGLLVTSGHGRGTVYCLPGQGFPTPAQTFGESEIIASRAMSGAPVPSSGYSIDSFGHSEGGSGHSERTHEGWLMVEGLSKSLIDKLERLDQTLCQQLEAKAGHAVKKKRLTREEMEPIIIALCQDHYLTLPVLCRLLHRQPDPLRKQYLKPMVEQGALALAFPTTPTHPQQAYTSTQPTKRKKNKC